jgi:hypothetical protein
MCSFSSTGIIIIRGPNRINCLKLLFETYNGDVNIGDVGNFNPLILSAYHGNLSCVTYCVKKGTMKSCIYVEYVYELATSFSSVGEVGL